MTATMLTGAAGRGVGALTGKTALWEAAYWGRRICVSPGAPCCSGGPASLWSISGWSGGEFAVVA